MNNRSIKQNYIKYVLTIVFCCVSIVGCSAKGIESSLKKGTDIVIRDQKFTSEFDFTKLVKSKLITPNRKHGVVNSNIVFIDCMFNGVKAFKQESEKMFTIEFAKNLIFHHCAFNSSTDLSYIQVNGDFSMLECEVAGTFSMNNAWFKGKSSSFTSVKFLDKVKAVNCQFDNRTSFLKAEFEQSASFQKSVFKGKSLMNGITFHKYAGFDKVIFANGVTFDKSIFKKDALFNNTTFMVEASFNGAQLSSTTSFSEALFLCKTSFKECNLADNLTLEQVSFSVDIPVLK